jgi:O-antigen/teichoic acid export membrane protein
MMGRHTPPPDDAAEFTGSAPTPSSAAPPLKDSGRAPRQWYGKVAKRGVAWSFVREAGTELIATPTGLVLARLLTPFDFGVAASAVVFLTLATRLTNFGFNLALARIKELRPEHSSSVFVVTIGFGAAAYAILASSGPLMASFFRAPQLAEIMPIAALGFLITPFGTVPAALMSREMRFRHTALCDWIQGVAGAITVITLALAGYGYWSLVYNQLASDIAGTIAKLVLSGWRPSLRFSFKAMKELFSFGTGVFAKRLLDYGASNVDNLVVGRTLGMSALGFYDKGFVTVRRILARLNTGGPMVSFRVLSLIHGEPERFCNAYRKVVLATSLLTYPMLLGLAVLGPDLIPVVYGPRWESTIVPFQILCIAGVFKVLTDYVGSAIQAMGKIWGQVGRQVIYAGLIVLLVAAFSVWGLPGAAFGVLLATFIMYLLMEGLLMQLTAITPRIIFGAQLPGLLCGIAVGVTVWTARWLTIGYLPFSPQWGRLLIQIATGGLMYVAFIKFNQFREVRRLIRDTAADLAPPFGRVVRLLG